MPINGSLARNTSPTTSNLFDHHGLRDSETHCDLAILGIAVRGTARSEGRRSSISRLTRCTVPVPTFRSLAIASIPFLVRS